MCKQGLELYFSSNCLGARQCKAIIDEHYPTCSLCANQILDSRYHELINGDNYQICDRSDDLHVKACLFYCRSNWIPDGECIKQNNVPMCKCGSQSEITTTKSKITTPIRTTITTTTTAPFESLLLTVTGHTGSVNALTILQNGDLVSGSIDKTIKLWNPVDGSLKKTLIGHTEGVCALTVLLNGDLVSGSEDKTIKIWITTTDGSLKRTLTEHTNSVYALTVLQNGDLVSGGSDYINKWNPIDGSLKRTLKLRLTGNIDFVIALMVLQNGDLVSGSIRIRINDWNPIYRSVKRTNNVTIFTDLFESDIKIWNPIDGSLKRTLTEHNSLAFSYTALQNGYLISGSDDKKIKI